MMGVWQPATNLKDYISHNPPGVTFFLCLLTLAISFICLSSYSYTHTLPNPDTAKDWNHLLSSLSQFQLCVKSNSSELVSPVPSPLMEQEKHIETLVNSTKTSSVTPLHLKVPLAVTASSASGSMKDLSLQTTLEASQLHLGGNEIVDVTLEFLPGNSTHTCLTISAPTHLLPMSLLPPECPAFEKNISPIRVEVSNQLPTASQTCYSLHSTNDPMLTVMLTQEEQTVAVHHLLEVSVCLLGVCVMLCLAASLTRSLTRRYHWNGLDLQNDPLIDT
ncbi:insulin-like growth factor-binding protein 3 receptor [Seriola aureovittata]|uniref:insulin-like growth factor-binding protein 3 receptor n=1 Tax=Seriola aureovittata TaxID=2871759 RepID=UPI0024BED73A|nr:insulin-like growth factor-binding protein 3 receptor [Seriola aureovittata]